MLAPKIMKRLLLIPLILVTLTALFAACTPVLPPVPTPAPNASPTTVAPTPTPPEPTQPPAPTAPPTPSLPAPALFDIPWDDRTPFAAGLIPAEQDALEERPFASVYHIDFTVRDDMTHVSGKLEVRYTNAETVALNEVLFRLFPNILGGEMKVTGVKVNGRDTKTLLETEDSVLRVAMPAPLQPGDQVVIAMDYDVTIPTTPGTNYAVLATMDDIMALAHAYPMIPAYDDDIGWYDDLPPNYGDVTYSDIAYYLVRASLPAGQVVQASGIELDRSESDGRQVITWAAGPMRDFYLVASPRYQVIEEKVGDTTVRAYAPGEYSAANELALDYATNALKVLNRYYGVYPFTELDVAGTPTLAGGVEYPGLIVVALQLYDPEQRFFEVATAHEVGHQWFYSVVGNDQIHHPWLDESLTQFNTLLYFEDRYGEAGYAMERMNFERRWEYIDNADIPLDLPVSAYDEAEYSGIIYGRGGLFFDELRKKIGDDAFETFQKNYYNAFKWDIATTDGLKRVAEDACGCDLTPMFEEWVYPKP